jgi:uncharacterized protein YndB with AHSA1/START domain
MSKRETLKFKRSVSAPPAEVFLAFTNATALREWFSDVAHVDAHKGGQVYFAWNQGYFSAGEITKLSPGKKIAFTWHGRGEPRTTEVEITLTAKKGGTNISVLHEGVGTGKKWKQSVAAITHGWEVGLENLQSVMETGHDQRFTLRPTLGVTGAEELTPETASRLGVPMEHGVRIDGTAPGLGAEAAGLRKDDVLVSLGGHKVSNGPTIRTALQAHRAGDKVVVVFYRGPEKIRVTMQLSQRPLLELPATAAVLAQAVRKMYDGIDATLAQVLQGVTDAEAAFHPAPDEWNVKETLAHLVLGERDTHAWIAELVSGDERDSNGAGGNSQIRTRATAAAYDTVPALLEELRRNESETVAMLAALPDDFVGRKRSYWRMANSIAQGADHVNDRSRQIEAAVAGARQPS